MFQCQYAKQARREKIKSFFSNLIATIIGCMIALFLVGYIIDAWIVEDQVRCETTMKKINKDPSLCK
jgi:uncharacterized membrane protein YdjX (TVP38/TMEM64 family)